MPGITASFIFPITVMHQADESDSFMGYMYIGYGIFMYARCILCMGYTYIILTNEDGICRYIRHGIYILSHILYTYPIHICMGYVGYLYSWNKRFYPILFQKGRA